MKQTSRFENKTSSRNYVVVLAYSRIGSLYNSKNTLIGNFPITYLIAKQRVLLLVNQFVCLDLFK